jgi:hypothetical protein
MHKRSATISLLTLLAGFTISACSAFFVPGVDDDGVQRCNTSEDCDPIDDNRHVAQCIYGLDQPENSDKVCSSDFKELTCHPEVQNGEGQLEALYEDVTSNQVKGAYGACDTAFEGMRGCAPRPANNPEMLPECDAGLEKIGDLCDDPNALYPAINPSQVGLTEIAGQDVLDQLCRFYFCDQSFVCDRSGSKPICRACDPNEPYGEGGCGTLYLDGSPSPVYTHIDENGGNCNGDIDLADIQFGTAPVP